MSLNRYIDIKAVKSYVVHNLTQKKEKYKSKELLFDYANIRKSIIDESDPTYIINIYIEICSLNSNNKYYKSNDKYSSILNIFIGLYYRFPSTIIALIEELPNYFFLINILSYILKIKSRYDSIHIERLKHLTDKIINIFVFQINKDSTDVLFAKKYNLSYPTISPLIVYLSLDISKIFIDDFVVKLFKKKKSISLKLFHNLKGKLLKCMGYLLDNNTNYAMTYDHVDIYTVNSVCLTRFYRNFFKDL